LKEFAMLIAVTSKDGIHIDQHFGHAGRFLIFEVDGQPPRLAGEVAADPYCSWGSIVPDMSPEQFAAAVQEMAECAGTPPPHHMAPEKLASVVASLGDCRVLATAMIGDAPRAELQRLGITVFAVGGPIATVLPELAKVL
jgi:predicted Fe-Mo cluster-binding NifX family protein